MYYDPNDMAGYNAAYQRQMTHLQGLADTTPMAPQGGQQGMMGANWQNGQNNQNSQQGVRPSACCCGLNEGTLYLGHPTQTVGAGGNLVFSRYSPSSDAEPAATLTLPQGRYLITYSTNASTNATTCRPADPTCTATLGIAPRINNVPFPRGGSFATVRAEGSSTLSSSFVINMPETANTLGFLNTGSLATTYQLLNVTVTRIC